MKGSLLDPFARVSSLPLISTAPGDNFTNERELLSRGYRTIAGTDEVGRGPLAGPVVAACVSLPKGCDPSPYLDSKKITHQQRVTLAERLVENGAIIGVGIVSHRQIDATNILQASLLAMKFAVHHHAAAALQPDFLLVDGKFEVPIDIAQTALVKGESKSASIAAASIIAKVKRDAIMKKLHLCYPQYGFATNKGYPTKSHREAIQQFGPSPYHRQSFKGVKEFAL